MDEGEFIESAVDLNGMIFGGASARWLQEHQLTPNDWNLDKGDTTDS
jgi:hypothetical protein